MNYEIIFDKIVIKKMNKLSKTEKERILEKLVSSKENPFIFFEKLTNRTDFKLRIGKYRIIADIDKTNNLIQITHFGLRKNIYNKI